MTTLTVDQRVQIPAHRDEWMQGDRFGTINDLTRNGLAYVRMDKSGRLLAVPVNQLIAVGETCDYCGELGHQWYVHPEARADVAAEDRRQRGQEFPFGDHVETS